MPKQAHNKQKNVFVSLLSLLIEKRWTKFFLVDSLLEPLVYFNSEQLPGEGKKSVKEKPEQNHLHLKYYGMVFGEKNVMFCFESENRWCFYTNWYWTWRRKI